MQTCSYGSSTCWISMVAMYLGWWLLASALLTFTWNKVIAHLTKVKPVLYWQSLLFVATLSVFIVPRAYWKIQCARTNHCYNKTHCCSTHKNCRNKCKDTCKGKTECPHHKANSEDMKKS